METVIKISDSRNGLQAEIKRTPERSLEHTPAAHATNLVETLLDMVRRGQAGTITVDKFEPRATPVAEPPVAPPTTMVEIDAEEERKKQLLTPQELAAQNLAETGGIPVTKVEDPTPEERAQKVQESQVFHDPLSDPKGTGAVTTKQIVENAQEMKVDAPVAPAE
jgi:hypothetical protein